MNIEYEATFANVDKDEIRIRLKGAGAELVRPEFLQKRVNYTLPGGSFLYDDSAGHVARERRGWLRVRDEGNKITLSLKAILNNDRMDGQKEICLIVDSFEQAEELLKSLGCKYKAYQESKREIWELDGVEICIDEWPWLEPFVEIEGTSEEQVRAIAEKLSFNWDKAIFGAVDVQYEKKYGVSKKRTNNETPRFVFGEPCPFE